MRLLSAVPTGSIRLRKRRAGPRRRLPPQTWCSPIETRAEHRPRQLSWHKIRKHTRKCFGLTMRKRKNSRKRENSMAGGSKSTQKEKRKMKRGGRVTGAAGGG